MLDQFHLKKVAVVGDIMLDRYVYGSVDRISPEAPIPVLRAENTESMLGGCGNVAVNLAKLGAQVYLTTVVGGDKAGIEIQRMLIDNGMSFKDHVHQDRPGIFPAVMVESWRTSTKKTRYIAAGRQQLLRADKETTASLSDTTRKRVIESAIGDMREADITIVSDYGKGVVSNALMRALIREAREHGKRIIVDPKSHDFGIYRGAFMVTPNLKELQATAQRPFAGEEDMIYHALREIEINDIEHMLLTRGGDGITLISRNGAVQSVNSCANSVIDVSGAGDTLIATLAMGLAAGYDLLDAAMLANKAAGIVVGRHGTSSVTVTDLKHFTEYENHLPTARKISSDIVAMAQVETWRKEGHRIGFANGCFDMLHNGHISLLQRARKHCDALIVAVNSDSSVRELKGIGRPVCNEIDRAMMLAALECVDVVCVFSEPTPEHLIEQLRPDVIFKGSDHADTTIVGSDIANEVIIIDRVTDHSTTGLIDRMRQSPLTIVK